MRYADFAAFKVAHPELAKVLETRASENDFLASMRERAETRKNFTPKMLAAIRKWVRTEVTEKIFKGDVVRETKIAATKISVSEDRYGKTRRHLHFGETAGGWRGKLELSTIPVSIEVAIENRIGMLIPTTVGELAIDPAVEIWIAEAEVLWTSPDGGFVILGGSTDYELGLDRDAREELVREAVAEAEGSVAEVTEASPAEVAEASPAPKRRPRKKDPRLPDFGSWQSSLKL